jgi:hypothetical protein
MNHPAPMPASDRRDPSLRAAARAALRVGIPLGGLAILYLLLDHVGWAQIGAAFRKIGVPLGLLLVALTMAEAILDSDALRRAMMRKISLGWTLISNSAGALVNMAVPFEAGEVVKGALLRRRSTDSRVLSGLVVWNYVWRLSKPALATACFALALALGTPFSARARWIVLGGIGFAYVPYAALRILIRLRPAERGARLLTRLPVLRKSAPRWTAAAATLDGEVRRFYESHPGIYAEMFLLQVGARFTTFLSIWILAHALGLPTNAGAVLLLYAAMAASDYVVMLVPARIGVSEGATYFLFQLLGLDPALGLVVGVAGRLRSILGQAPFAFAAYWVTHGRTTPAAGEAPPEPPR